MADIEISPQLALVRPTSPKRFPQHVFASYEEVAQWFRLLKLDQTSTDLALKVLRSGRAYSQPIYEMPDQAAKYVGLL
jgi:hypothetical protein